MHKPHTNLSMFKFKDINTDAWFDFWRGVELCSKHNKNFKETLHAFGQNKCLLGEIITPYFVRGCHHSNTPSKHLYINIQGVWEHWTSLKLFSYSLVYQLWGLLLNWIGWSIQLSVQAFQLLIVSYKRGNFVNHHLSCTSIYWPLSYPFRSLINIMPEFKDSLIAWSLKWW